MTRPDLPYTDPVLGGCYEVCDHWMHDVTKPGCDKCRCDTYVMEIVRLRTLLTFMKAAL